MRVTALCAHLCSHSFFCEERVTVVVFYIVLNFAQGGEVGEVNRKREKEKRKLFKGEHFLLVHTRRKYYYGYAQHPPLSTSRFAGGMPHCSRHIIRSRPPPSSPSLFERVGDGDVPCCTVTPGSDFFFPKDARWRRRPWRRRRRRRLDIDSLAPEAPLSSSSSSPVSESEPLPPLSPPFTDGDGRAAD